MNPLRRKARTCLILFCPLLLGICLKSDAGKAKRSLLYERAVQGTTSPVEGNVDIPAPTSQTTATQPSASPKKDDVPSAEDLAAKRAAAQAAYRRISLDVGALAAKDLLDDTYEGDNPKEVDRWLMAMLTKACGEDESRCSITLAAQSAQAAMEGHIKELHAKGKAGLAYVLAEATAGHADKEVKPKPLRGIDVAIAAHDPKLADRYAKEQTADREDEAQAVLALVSSLEGRHLDMPELVPSIDKDDPVRGILIRKALRHQYRTIKEWLLPLAMADCASGVPDKCDEAESLQKTLIELESVNATLNFL